MMFWFWLSLLLLKARVVGGSAGVVPLADCSQFQQVVNAYGVSFSFTSILDNGIGPNGYLRVRVAYEGINWLGFGVSRSGLMVPGFATIGVPALPRSATNPGKYQLNGNSVALVNLMKQSQQTLHNASIVQNATHTVLSFTKRMLEIGEYPIYGNQSNAFIFAVGASNTLAFHMFSGRIVVPLRACTDGVPIVMTPSPSKSPTFAPTPIAELNIPYTFPPTTMPSLLPPGATSSPTSIVTSSPTLSIYNVTTVSPSSYPSNVPSDRSSSTAPVMVMTATSRVASNETASKPATSAAASSGWPSVGKPTTFWCTLMVLRMLAW